MIRDCPGITRIMDRDVPFIIRRCDGTVSEDLKWRHFPIVVGSNPTNAFIFIPLYIFITKSILTNCCVHRTPSHHVSLISSLTKMCFHTYSLPVLFRYQVHPFSKQFLEHFTAHHLTLFFIYICSCRSLF